MSNGENQKVKVVIDSTADMSLETIKELDLEMVPLTVLIGDQAYRDGIDITSEEFYQRLPTLSKLPTTSQPSPGLFLKAYEKAVEGGMSVISIHLSAKLSGTYANAVVAARNFPEGQVRVFDTQQVSAGVAFFVRTAVEMARQGRTIDEIEAEMERMRSLVKIIATVDTLEYLHKGGRIGGLKNFFGSLLSVKPILQLKDGEVQPLEQVRTRAKALQRVAELAKAMGPIDRLAIMHAADPNSANELVNLLAPVFPKEKMFISELGPVIGAHAGPRTVGVGIQKAG
jgi:DegV family protein with EDD domain